MTNKFFKLGALLVVLMLFVAFNAFAQSTVYVDVTNGSDSYSGANAINNPPNTGPKATINGGIAQLATNGVTTGGTLVIAAGDYNGGDNAGGNVNITTQSNLTIQLLWLTGNKNVNLTAGSFTYNKNGSSLTVTTAGNGEYLTIGSGLLNLGGGANSSSIGMASASYMVLPSGATITMNNTSSFTNAAPTRTTNVTVNYVGAGTQTAGPEGNYATYGTGSIGVNFTSGSVTFPYDATVNGFTQTAGSTVFNGALTVGAGNLTVTAGNATFNGLVTMGANDITNNGTGTVTFAGTVAFSITDGAAAGNLGQVVNAAAGSMVFSGPVTWTAGTLGAARDFTVGPVNVINNVGAGSISFNSTMTFSNSQANAAWDVTVPILNNAGGTLSLGTIGAATGGTGATKVIINVANTTGTINLAGGLIRGSYLNPVTSTTNVNGATTVGAAVTNAGTIALGANTLTLSGGVAHLTNTGTFTGATGIVSVTGAGATFNGGTFTNVSIASGASASFITNNSTLNNDLTVTGTVTIPDGITVRVKGNVTQTGTVNLGAGASGILRIDGNFNRTSGAFNAGAGSDLQFMGSTAQAVNSGPLFQTAKLTFTNTSGTITLGASIRASALITISASTNVDLSTFNLVLNAAAAAMVNNGTYSAVGGGGVILGGNGAPLVVNGFAGNMAATLSGSGLYSYITVDVGAANTATLAGSIRWTGVLTLRTGTLATGGFNLDPNGSSASIVRWVVSSPGITGGATFDPTNTQYDLTYTEALVGPVSVATGAGEYSAGNVRNLTVSTTAFVLTLTSAAPVIINGNLTLSASALFALDAAVPYNTTVKGTMTISSAAVLSGGNAANFIYLSGNSMTHSVVGTISNVSMLTVQGTGSALNGTGVPANACSIVNLYFEPTANASTFTSTNLKQITAGPLQVEGVVATTGNSATITMDGANGALVGNLLIGNGANSATVALTIAGTTTSTHTGNIVLTNGLLTYTRGGASTTLTGNVTLTAGTMTLGSDLSVNGSTVQTAGNLALGSFNYTQIGTGGSPDFTGGTGTVTGTGWVKFNATAAAIDVTPGAAPYTIPNVEFIDGTGNGITMNAPMVVSTALKHTSGAVGYNTITLSGNTYTYVAGTVPTGTLIFTGSTVVATFSGNVTIPSVTVNLTGSTLTLAGSPSTTARTVTVSGVFTQTAGDIYLGIHTLAFTGGAGGFVRVAGNWYMTTGLVQFNSGTLTFDPGTGWALDNLTVTLAAANSTTKTFTVNKYLTLAGAFTTQTGGTTSGLILGDNATIERQANGATLDLAPTFGATSINLKYTTYTGGNITTQLEIPTANIIQNFTVAASGNVILAVNIQVNNTLDLAALLNAVTNNKTVTMAANTNLMLRVNGGTALDKNLVLLGALNITYNGATATSTRELGAISSDAHTSATGNVTIMTSVAADAGITFGGTLTFDGGNLDGAGWTINVQGDAVQTANGGFFGSTVANTPINFTGATNTNLTLNMANNVVANDKLTIKKTNATNTVTLNGGDLNFATNSATLYFNNGVLVTGGTTNVVLKQSATTVNAPGSANAGQPTQGFDRSGVTGTNESHVYGRVKKYVNNGPFYAIDISVVTFPVGTLNPKYRPMSYFFKTAPGSSINLTVSHVDSKAGGVNGYPIAAGTLSITNYPDFFWYAKSDIPIAPSYQYDLEAQGKGYTDYQLDGIQNIRFVRRDSGSVNNQWILQKNYNTGTILYDNSTIASDWPVVKVIDATGGITTQGSIFTYSQSDKPPAFSAAPTSVTINENQAFSGTYVAADPDLNQTVTLSVQSTNITGYTFVAGTGVFTWTPGYFDAGTKTLTIRATSSAETQTFADHKDTTITITVTNVNRPPSFTDAVHDTTIVARQALTVTFTAADVDTDQTRITPLQFAKVSGPADATINATTGVFTWTPAVGDTGVASVVLSVTDGVAPVNRAAWTITVLRAPRVPVFTASLAAALNANMGSTVNFTYVAADSDGLPITYSITKNPGGATIGATSGAFNYYVPYNVPGTYLDTVTVTASNGTYTVNATTVITRVYMNVKPYFTAKLTDRTLFVGDTLSFTYAASDSNGDAMKFYGVQYPQGARIDSVTGAFFWVAASQQTAIYVIKTRVTDNLGGADTTFAQVMVQVVQVNVTGTVKYNGGNVPVNGVTVTITRTDVVPNVVTTLTTNTNGAYTTDPTKLNSGSYTFGFTKTGGHPTVYTNAADALKAALFSVDPVTYPLTVIRQAAADVNNDTQVNSADALQIMLRYVGSVTSFAKGDWTFVPTYTSLTLTTADRVDDATAIAVGDVNGDAQPGGAYFAKASGTPSVAAEAGKALRVNSTDVFEVPVRVKAAASLGSISMAFQYSTEAATFIGVRGPEGMVSASNNGVVAVAWFNAEHALNLKENDAVVTLRFKPTSNIKDFSLTLDPNSQVTNAQGAVLSGINLDIPAVDGSVPTVFALGLNYPNPFNPSTTIQYDLPVAGHVTLVVYNMLGQVVDKLVDDQQNAGAYKIRWDASKMSSGVYMYHITVDAGKQTFKEVRRMVLLK